MHIVLKSSKFMNIVIIINTQKKIDMVGSNPQQSSLESLVCWPFSPIIKFYYKKLNMAGFNGQVQVLFTNVKFYNVM